MKICLVCSSGGHIIELLKLKGAFNSDNVFLVTHNDKVLNWSDDIPKVYLIKNVIVGKAHVNRIYKFLLLLAYVFIVTTNEFVILLKEKPDVIVSTGSAIAVPIFYMGKLINTRLIYVESVCRVSNLSLAGKMIYPIADEFLVQWNELTTKYKKAQYKGNVLFKTSKIESEESIKGDFIFVMIGTAPFPRLVKKMDEFCEKFNERVIMQIGRTQYKPKNAEYFDFVKDISKIQELCQKARVVVTHSGAGSIMTALEQDAIIITVPRLRRLGEAYDDHQFELPEALSKDGYVKVVYDVEELEGVLMEAYNIKHPDVSYDKMLINFLRECLEGVKK